jgi:alcohol dehydrogenase class IV
LIKNFITVDLGMKKDQVAQKVLDYLKSLNISSEVKEDVHSQTLKAWFKGEIEEGRSVPSDLFQTYVTNRAKLK